MTARVDANIVGSDKTGDELRLWGLKYFVFNQELGNEIIGVEL
jgi:hypothetical protein